MNLFYAFVMRTQLILLLIFTSISLSHAQEWVPYAMSNGVEISFPAKPTVTDTTGYKYALLDTAGIRLLVSEEFLVNYKYKKDISTENEVLDFYQYIVSMAINAKTGASTLVTASEKVRDLVLLRATFSVGGTPLASCETKFLLLNQRVYLIQACRITSDTTTIDIQTKFFSSLAISSDNIILDQFATTQDKLQSTGAALPIVTGMLFVAWLVLYIILIIRTRSAEAPVLLRKVFAVLRWTCAALLFLVFVGFMIILATGQIEEGISKTFAAIGIISGLFAILVATLRAPSANKPVL